MEVSIYDTFLHKIFSQSTAGKLIRFLFGKFVCIFFGILLLICVISACIKHLGGMVEIINSFFLIFNWFCYGLLIPYQIFVLSSLNVTITGQVIKTLTFWIKTLYFILFWICATFFSCYDNNGNLTYQNDESKALCYSNNSYFYLHGFYLC